MCMRMRMRCVHGGVIENLDEQTRVVVTAAAFTAPASAIVATRPLSNSTTAKYKCAYNNDSIIVCVRRKMRFSLHLKINILQYIIFMPLSIGNSYDEYNNVTIFCYLLFAFLHNTKS